MTANWANVLPCTGLEETNAQSPNDVREVLTSALMLVDWIELIWAMATSPAMFSGRVVAAVIVN